VSEGAEYCDECAGKDHSYSFGIAVFEYDSRMRRSMSDFKFNGWKENADYYVHTAVSLYEKEILGFAPGVLIPVPIHKSKLLYRGYNQAELIARGIGSRLGIRTVTDLLVRNKRTRAQKNLGQEDRSANLKTAFDCDRNKYGKEEIEKYFSRVLLIDDIYTTGATMEGCAGALIAAGVRQVGILSIAAGGGH